MTVAQAATEEEKDVTIEVGRVRLSGTLGRPRDARGIVLFAHGSGSSRHSPRNRHVAETLREAGLTTLLMDLLTPEEEALDLQTAQLRFDIAFLARRLAGATEWLAGQPDLRPCRIGYFGASTGAGAALVAAAARPDLVKAVVSRGGRPDLAGPALSRVRAPTLLVVGGHDRPVLQLNKEALARLPGDNKLVVVPGASHLFEEPGALDEAAHHARQWFERYLVTEKGGR